MYLFLSSSIINYKKLRKNPSQILQKINWALTNAHWPSTFLAYGKGKKVVG